MNIRVVFGRESQQEHADLVYNDNNKSAKGASKAGKTGI